MAMGRRRLWQAATGNGAMAKEMICPSCLRQLSKRNYASAAAATAESAENPAQALTSKRPSAPPLYKQEYKVEAGVVLSRPPQITRDLTPFEKSFFLYQRRLNERLALPFTRYHYFTRKTPVFKEWQRKLKLRQTPAHEIGVYNAYGREGWNDEVLVGARESETQHQVDAILEEASNDGMAKEEGETSSGEVIERPSPRVTEADKTGDQKSLDRLLQQSLYLLVQTPDDRWIFPTDSIAGREGLRDAAERVLVEGAGPHMNTWVVGNAPIGHYLFNYQNIARDGKTKTEVLGQQVFFMKARIMAGQANIKDNRFGWKDFKWLSKAEIESVVTRKYWSDIRRMLPRR